MANNYTPAYNEKGQPNFSSSNNYTPIPKKDLDKAQAEAKMTYVTSKELSSGTKSSSKKSISSSSKSSSSKSVAVSSSQSNLSTEKGEEYVAPPEPENKEPVTPIPKKDLDRATAQKILRETDRAVENKSRIDSTQRKEYKTDFTPSFYQASIKQTTSVGQPEYPVSEREREIQRVGARAGEFVLSDIPQEVGKVLRYFDSKELRERENIGKTPLDVSPDDIERSRLKAQSGFAEARASDNILTTIKETGKGVSGLVDYGVSSVFLGVKRTREGVIESSNPENILGASAFLIKESVSNPKRLVSSAYDYVAENPISAGVEFGLFSKTPKIVKTISQSAYAEARSQKIAFNFLKRDAELYAQGYRYDAPEKTLFLELTPEQGKVQKPSGIQTDLMGRPISDASVMEARAPFRETLVGATDEGVPIYAKESDIKVVSDYGVKYDTSLLRPEFTSLNAQPTVVDVLTGQARKVDPRGIPDLFETEPGRYKVINPNLENVRYTKQGEFIVFENKQVPKDITGGSLVETKSLSNEPSNNNFIRPSVQTSLDKFSEKIVINLDEVAQPTRVDSFVTYRKRTKGDITTISTEFTKSTSILEPPSVQKVEGVQLGGELINQRQKVISPLDRSSIDELSKSTSEVKVNPTASIKGEGLLLSINNERISPVSEKNSLLRIAEAKQDSLIKEGLATEDVLKITSENVQGLEKIQEPEKGLKRGGKRKSKSLLDISTSIVNKLETPTTLKDPIFEDPITTPRTRINSTRSPPDKTSSKIRLDFDLPRTKKEKNFVEFAPGFNVRIKGKLVSNDVFTREEAYAYGGFIVDASSQAGFEITPAGTGAKAGKFSGSFNKEKFYTNKAGRVIEKNKFRIDSPGEKTEITFKGIASRSKKKFSLFGSNNNRRRLL